MMLKLIKTNRVTEDDGKKYIYERVDNYLYRREFMKTKREFVGVIQNIKKGA